jgi:N-glycosylase/DNA lyase
VSSETSFSTDKYDLAATLTSGQAFRWRNVEGTWEGVVAGRWLRLRQIQNLIHAETATPVGDWDWLRHYLQLDVEIEKIFATFPQDEPMQNSLRACTGLRLLRQEPWECLASFICSSTKQIVQIQQIIALLCEHFGEPLPTPPGHGPVFSFPHFSRLAELAESDLRGCKLGFRAPYLLNTARKLRDREIDLMALHQLPLDEAREQLMHLPGVGAKIADCVLLFAYDFPQAFPVDVWVARALQHLYFPKRRVKLPRLLHFSRTHFGPYSGYAQQYLFHYMRTKHVPAAPPLVK